MIFVKIGAVSNHTLSNGVNKFLPWISRLLATLGKIWDPYMTLFSSTEYHKNPYSERHGQNVYVREFRKNRSWEGYTFLTDINCSGCREKVRYLQSRERLGKILILRQAVHSLSPCSYRQHYMIQLCINIYVWRYSNYKDCLCVCCNVITTEWLKVLYNAQQLFPHLVFI